ncbi:IucA/IucC family protein [Cryptosporangium arvum]|uniref:Siderophore synthetase component n=1 Tax=Cryptosporangium arvum DSM 44712 TaxID=927661 RepID=A0A011ABP4_9ACTN|nr:IucA/IucC family protein [Cryptosporangium arvum]EXG79446.1 siderophore synthetase component [Cryptosporangium arvum DSM 44712]
MNSSAWREAGLVLLTRAIAELSYEDMLRPEPLGDRRYRLDCGGVKYTFTADRSAFDSWRIDADSIRRDGEPAADPMEFLVDARRVLGLDGPTTAEALRELVATWSADALLRRNLPTARELADASYVDLEAAQAGHPAMVLNKGRLGFTASDAEAYAPEAGQTFRLTWIAVHPSLATAHGVPVDDELDPGTRSAFDAPDGYVWLPVHPFHLDACVRTLFAPYLADGRIVILGEAPDRYRALASVRTLVNVDNPEKRNVKVPLLIRNTLVWRGLPAGPTAGAPAVSAWLHTLRASDPYLDEHVDLLGEVASVAVRHPLFDRVPDAPYRYHELLAAVWREPVQTYLKPGERARSLASLLVTGSDGVPLTTELTNRSGLSAREWLRRLVDAVLAAPLHALHAHDLAFCPHGENTVVVFDSDDVPVRTMLKDFAEDVNLLPGRVYPGLPEEADRLLPRWSEGELAHSIVTAVFAGVFRPLAALVDVPDFWAVVRASVDAYFADRPELAERREAYGLTAAEVERICLNREQLTGGGFHDRAEKEEFEIVHGTVANPLVREAGR